MLEILRTSQFRRDVKKAQKRGKDIDRLKTVIILLAQGRTLPARYKDHQLKGVYKDCRECHIEPDLPAVPARGAQPQALQAGWLLIYRIEAAVLQLIRTGSHSDLFT